MLSEHYGYASFKPTNTVTNFTEEPTRGMLKFSQVLDTHTVISVVWGEQSTEDD